ncbi:DUF3859 domain-containing protein [candidate division WOR-3 bacterium]|nr:DUF3859 domain-containing protein [candidate division WOR-3 bacterium]
MTRKIRTYRKAMSVFRVFIVVSIIFSFLFCKSAMAQDRIIYLHPTAGGEKFLVDDKENLLSFQQLIPVYDENDEKKLNSYLKNILTDEDMKILGKMTVLDALTGFIDLEDDNTDYIYISLKSKELVVKNPYMNEKSGPVWFEVEKWETEENEYVSIWYFRRKRNEDFNIILKIKEDTRMEFGRFSLLPEEFKKGKQYNQVHNNFKIEAYGEYYSEPLIQYLPEGKEEYTSLGFISYTDSIDIAIGTLFGFRYELIDSTKEGEYTFNVIHPEFKTGPEKGQTELKINKSCLSRKFDDIIWEFSEEYELVPGTWTIQLLNGDKILYEKRFYLSLDNKVDN